MLQCGHSNWDTLDCPITTFSGNKRPSSIFLWTDQLHSRLNNIIVENFQTLWNLWMLLVCLQKTWKSFVSENVVIGQSSSKWPALSVRTVSLCVKKKKDQYLSSSFTRGTCRISCPRFCTFSITSITYHLCSCCYVFVATFGCFHEWQV